MARREKKTKNFLYIQEDCCGKASKVFEFQYFDSPEQRGGWEPNMDIFESEKDICVLIEAAGLNEESLNLHAVDNRLVVSAERQLKFEETICQYHQLEIQFLPFQKTVILPGTIEASEVDAKYNNGMLFIRVPKKALR